MGGDWLKKAGEATVEGAKYAGAATVEAADQSTAWSEKKLAEQKISSIKSKFGHDAYEAASQSKWDEVAPLAAKAKAEIDEQLEKIAELDKRIKSDGNKHAEIPS